MTLKFRRTYVVRAALVAALSCSLAALAAPPASVVGNWSIQANQTAGQLIVSQQGNTPGPCRLIVGSVFARAMNGIYCPSSGRIQFMRLNQNQRVDQVYTGNVGDAIAGSPLRIGGTMTVTVPSAGFFGEYNFNASK